jgi:hypothetical protein
MQQSSYYFSLRVLYQQEPIQSAHLDISTWFITSSSDTIHSLDTNESRVQRCHIMRHSKANLSDENTVLSVHTRIYIWSHTYEAIQNLCLLLMNMIYCARVNC